VLGRSAAHRSKFTGVSEGDQRREQPEETPKERADRELVELLNEVRVALPGVTVLFGFLLALPFTSRWQSLSSFEKGTFLVAFLSTATAIAFLVANSSYHRLLFRGEDKERLVKLGNLLTIAGITFLAVALTAVVQLVTQIVIPGSAAAAATTSVAVLLLALWYGLPLARRLRQSRRARS
jgi:amino acid transporter